jgi:choline dehydrogenase-like flavoprotein
MVGFRPVPDGVDVFESAPPPAIDLAAARPPYDVVVVGGGAGGGVAAGVLAEAGARVLLVERAPAWHNHDLRGDHLRGKRMSVYAGNAGPGAGNPRVFRRVDGSVVRVDADANPLEWGLVANCLGGGTRLWHGMAWRFFPEDFAMASTYGVPDGSSMADWPFGYDELAPYYDRAEWEIGVAGPSHGPIVQRTARARPYPMPPLVGPEASLAYALAAQRLGWSIGPVPFAINSEPRLGRPACVGCPQCVGHACPVDAKNGPHNTLVPRAVATGRCDIVMHAQAVELLHDGRGRATAVHIVTTTDEGIATHTVACGHVVVAAGVVETPRLLLASGLGNASVGRNLHAHTFALAFAVDESTRRSYADPGHSSVATLDFVHRDREAWGGGVLFDTEMALPLLYAQLAPTLGGPRFGLAHKQWMRTAIGNVTGAMGIGQEVPDARSSVSIDRRITDRVGMPAALVTRVAHPAAATTTSYLQHHVVEWIEAAGGRGVVDLTPPPGMFAVDEHSGGTCRLGEDPGTSACDPTGRVHGTANVWVADASLHPTNGSVNPGLTVLANAFRVADRMVTAS